MSAERDELHRLIEKLPDEQVAIALAEVRNHVEQAPKRAWPPPWFGAATASRTDTAARAEEILDAGFGRPA